MTLNTEAQKGSRKDFARVLPGLLISGAALAITLYFVDVRKLVEALKVADYRFAAAGVIASFVWLVARAFFWQILLKYRAGLKDVLFTLSEGYLLNNVLPFRLGEVGRAYLMGRKAGLDFWHVLSTIVIERALDVAYAAGILLVTLPFVVGGGWARPTAIIMGSIVIAGLVFLYFLARNTERAQAVFDRLAQRVPLIQRIGGNMIRSFLQGISILNSPALFVRAIGWMTLNWLIALGQYYLFMRAFFPQAQWLWAAFALGASAMGLAAPASPGSIGVYEGVLVFAMSLFTDNPGAAFAFAIVAHLSGYIINGIMGSYALAREGETLAGLYRSARAMLSRTKS